MNNKSIINLPTLTKDGKIYHNPQLNTVESLIPSPYGSNHACDLLELQNGDILCAWFAGSEEGNTDINVVLSRLDSGSSQWCEPVTLSDDPVRSEQNPSLFLHPNGEIWAMYTAQQPRIDDENVELVGGMYISQGKPGSSKKARFNLQYTAQILRKISKDGGHTWGKTETMFPTAGSFCRQKIQILSNGRWIFGNWICYDDNSHNGTDITVMMISDDKGQTWRGVEVPKSRGRVHPYIIEIDAVRLVALFRSRSADNIYISHSFDYGENWTEPARTCLPNNNSGISAIKLSSDRLAVVYNNFCANSDPTVTLWPYERAPMVVALSEDNGASWPYRRILESGDGFIGEANLKQKNNRRHEYPCIMQSKDGAIHVAYSFASRICMKHCTFDENWVLGQG